MYLISLQTTHQLVCGLRICQYGTCRPLPPCLCLVSYDERKQGKFWMAATGIQYPSVQMETKSQMLHRKVICIDLFVPFQRTTTCCKHKVIPRVKASVHPANAHSFSFNVSLFQAWVGNLPLLPKVQLCQLRDEMSLFWSVFSEGTGKEMTHI